MTSVDLRGSITVQSQAQLDLEKAVVEADSVQLKAGGGLARCAARRLGGGAFAGH